jgi:D-sedoheptulose 7-phosphate isomerase
MRNRTENLLTDLYVRYPSLKTCEKNIIMALELLKDNYKSANKILICGNGGSAADSEHISGELLKSFMLKRSLDNDGKNAFLEFGEEGEKLQDNLQKAIKAIPLNSFNSALTAYMNDVNPELVFAQLVYALGAKNDVLLSISTSGNSKNIYYASITAKTIGLKNLGLTGEEGGKLKDLCDICIRVPETETYKIQELHLPVYHFLCAGLEEELFGI